LESRHYTHNHHFRHYEATEERINLWVVAEPQKDCTHRYRRQKCGIEAECEVQSNNPNAVYVRNADLDREDTRNDNMEPCDLMALL
jgi:hypothetical protein